MSGGGYHENITYICLCGIISIIQASYNEFPYFYHRYTLPSLNYTVCTDGDIQQVG